MNKCYTKIEFQDSPSTDTPLARRILDKMDSAINEIDNRVVDMANGEKVTAFDLDDDTVRLSW